MSRFTDTVVLADGREFTARHSVLTYLSGVEALSPGDRFVLARRYCEPETREVLHSRSLTQAGITAIESRVVVP